MLKRAEEAERARCRRSRNELERVKATIEELRLDLRAALNKDSDTSEELGERLLEQVRLRQLHQAAAHACNDRFTANAEASHRVLEELTPQPPSSS